MNFFTVGQQCSQIGGCGPLPVVRVLRLVCLGWYVWCLTLVTLLQAGCNL